MNAPPYEERRPGQGAALGLAWGPNRTVADHCDIAYSAGFHDGWAAYEDADAEAWAGMRAAIRHTARTPEHARLLITRAQPSWADPRLERNAAARARLGERAWLAGVHRSWGLPTPVTDTATRVAARTEVAA